MPNTAKIYHDILYPPEEIIPEQKDAARIQLKINWLESTITQEMFKQLKKDADSIVDHTIALACTEHSQDTSKQIIANLIRVNELRKITQQYGRPTS